MQIFSCIHYIFNTSITRARDRSYSELWAPNLFNFDLRHHTLTSSFLTFNRSNFSPMDNLFSYIFYPFIIFNDLSKNIFKRAQFSNRFFILKTIGYDTWHGQHLTFIVTRYSVFCRRAHNTRLTHLTKC